MTFKCKEGCHACCSVPPLDKKIYERNKHLIKVEVNEIKAHNKIIPVTEDNVCPFLIDEKCIIYEDRPRVCKDMGQTPKMPCPFVKVDGTLRNKFEVQKITNFWDKKFEKLKSKGVL
jgi:Fe-S-cluster containining protein